MLAEPPKTMVRKQVYVGHSDLKINHPYQNKPHRNFDNKYLG